MTRLLLFDIDGTLIRTGGAGVRAFGKVFDRVFNARHGFEKLRFAGGTDYGIVREFFEVHGIRGTKENYAKFFEAYAQELQVELATANLVVCPGVREFIGAARALPCPPIIGLLTGNVRIGAETKLKAAGLWEDFAMGGFAEDHELRGEIAKAARARGEALAGRSMESAEILVVGDTPHDISCARAIGARVLAVATGGATYEELALHKPDYLVETLHPYDPHWLTPSILG